MDLLESHVGLTLRTALVVNDVLAMVFFALVFGVGNSLVLLLQISLFFLVTIVIGFLVVRYMLKKSTKSYSASIALTSGLCICFLFAAFAENMGLTAIIGAFIAGLFIKKTSQAGVVAEYVKTIGYTFFVPLFFVWIGASFNFLAIFQSNQIMSILLFSVVFIVFAMLGNFIGSSFGARIAGFKRRDAISVGIGMMPVMGVALIIVSTGIDRGIFGDPSGFLANQVKTATLLLIFTSCFVSPVLFKRSMGFSLFKKNMKTKTKLSSYRHPHCVKCDYPLRFSPRNNKWFCDRCQNFSILPTKRSSALKLESGDRTDYIIRYVIGAMTIVMLTFAIQMSVNISFFDKIFAILGIFIGTTLAFLTLQYFRTNRKTTLYKIYHR
ncbi:MAG: cation:proton antiporter [Candidatus Thermoplasmatota archaeon]|nr:cation:proton antiporter [Candidatus Thermoplasmatota archaeon]